MSEERTEPATPQRLERAREEGQVAQSRDLTGAIGLVGVAAALAGTAGSAASGVRELCEHVAARFGEPIDGAVMASLGGEAFALLLRTTAPPLGVALLLGVLLPWLQARPVPSAEPLRPKFERLNPVQRLQRMYLSLAGWIEFGKACLKVLVIGAATGLLLWSWLPSLLAGAGAPLPAVLARGAEMLWTLLLVATVPLVVLGVLDLLFQKWNLQRSLRMSSDELRREVRDDEGSPELRTARDRHWRELEAAGTRKTLLQSRVVVTNPTHLACALAYDPRRDDAPRLVAKAEGELAQQIRSTARACGIPVREDRPLARALFELPTETPIPPELYEAAAVVLRWADALPRRGRNRAARAADAVQQPDGAGRADAAGTNGFGPADNNNHGEIHDREHHEFE